MKLNPLLKGTITLTVAGLITRFLGFFYRIFLSNSMGAEKLGLYQLVFPIYGVCHTIYAAGIQTALSKHVAEAVSENNLSSAKKMLVKCIFLSILLACCLSAFLFINAGFVAEHILMEPDAESSLRALSLCFPFCGITSCVNGYYYGRKKTFVPASTQLLEQIIRILFVYAFSVILFGDVSCELAVLGVVVGEIISAAYNLISLYRPSEKNTGKPAYSKTRSLMKPIIQTAVPLTLNRFLLNILHSFEAVLIPVLLRRSGLSNSEALAVFGIVTGMAVPFLAFPSTLTNSLSVLLLPEVSEAAYNNKADKLKRTILLTTKYSLQLGIISAALFCCFGRSLGVVIFNEPRAGYYLAVLSLLCPLMYLTTTLGSILNGLGKQNTTFLNSVLGSSIKLILIVILIPAYGICGYFISLYVGQIIIMIFDMKLLSKSGYALTGLSNALVKPVIIAFFSGILSYGIYDYLSQVIAGFGLLLLLFFCMLHSLIYVIFLKLISGP